MTKSENKDSNIKGRLGLLASILFIDLVGFSIVFPLFPAMLDYYLSREGPESLIGRIIQFCQSFSTVDGEENTFLTTVLFGGFLGSLYSILQFGFAPLWGRLSDRYGRRVILLYTVIGTALSYALWFFSASFALLLIARIVGGITSANLGVVTAAAADLTDRKNRSKGMAVIGIAFGLGFIVGPAIGGLASLVDLSELWPAGKNFGINPFSLPAAIALCLTIFNCIWVALFFKESLPIEKRSNKTVTPQQYSFFKKIFSLENRTISRILLVYLLYMIAFAGMEFTLTFLAVERLDYSPQNMIDIFLFVGLMLILVQGGIVRQKRLNINEKHLVLSGLISCMIALAILANTPLDSEKVFFLGLAFLGIGAGLVNPTLSAFVSLYSDEHNQGKNLGLLRSMGALARALSPFLAAMLYYMFGSQFAYLLGALILLLPLIIGITLPQPSKKISSPEQVAAPES